jgi:hypothetical protein
MKDAISWKELNLCLGVILDIFSCSFTSISFLTTENYETFQWERERAHFNDLSLNCQ